MSGKYHVELRRRSLRYYTMESCFTLESGHPRCKRKWPLSANRGHCVRFASKHRYSMISSAIESTPDGTVSPSAFAVFKFSTSSNFVDWLTGTSTGFSPLRIRPV